MPRLLLIVTDTFAIKSRGLIVGPDVDIAEARPAPVTLEIRKPDGAVVQTKGYIQVPHFNPPRAVHRASVTLLDLSKDDIPIGTEVWTAE